MVKKSTTKSSPSPSVEESKRVGIKFWKKNKRKKKVVVDDNKPNNDANREKDDIKNKKNITASNKENISNKLNLANGGNDNDQYQNEVRGSPGSTSSKSHYSQLEVTQPGIIGDVNRLTLDNNVVHDVKDAVNVSGDSLSIPPPPPPKSSPPPTPRKDTSHLRNKMCIQKLQELARLHGGSPPKLPPNANKIEGGGAAVAATRDANTPSKVPSNQSSSTPTTSKLNEEITPTKAMTALQQKIKNKILGSSPTWSVQKETKETLKELESKPEASPSSVINLSSLKNGIQELANSSLTSIFNCATTLKQVQCENLQDGVYELKEDLFYTYGKSNRHGRESEYDDYYDDESFQTDDDGTKYTYDDTTIDGPPTIATKDTKTTRDASIFDDGTSLEDSSYSNANEPRSSPMNNQQQQQHQQQQEYIDKEDEFALSNDNLQPKQIEKLGIPINDKIPSGEIPMKEKSPNVQSKHLANPTTSNIPWDERSVSSKSSDMVIGTRGVRLGEGGLVSLHDIDKSMRMSNYHEDYGLQNPLRYQASSNLRKDEGEI